jgi:[ribosomal protein S18]-alanine N-acetyltransferase
VSDDAFSVSPMRKRDLKAVLAIEALVFPEPWSKTVFSAELAQRTGRAYRAGWLGQALVGYYGMMYVDDEAHVTTLAVSPDRQRTGVGTALLHHGVSEARDRGVTQVSLEVAAGNERAQALYRRFGFAPVGVRKNYYQRSGEDAYVMWAHDVDAPAYAQRLAAIAAEMAVRP